MQLLETARVEASKFISTRHADTLEESCRCTVIIALVSYVGDIACRAPAHLINRLLVQAQILWELHIVNCAGHWVIHKGTFSLTQFEQASQLLLRQGDFIVKQDLVELLYRNDAFLEDIDRD